MNKMKQQFERLGIKYFDVFVLHPKKHNMKTIHSEARKEQDMLTKVTSQNWGKVLMVEELKSKLSSLPTEESRWIAMSERLPDRDDWQEYLVSSKDSVTTMHWNDYEQVWMKNKRIHVGDQSLFGDVIAWQVLPKPPLQ